MSLRDKKILVTGGSGFVGTNLVKRLLKLNVDVKTVLHKRPQIHLNDSEKYRVSYCWGDLTDSQFCRYCMEDVDIVVMCAAQTSGAAVMEKTPLAHVTPNVIMNTNLLDASYEAGIEKFIFISSNTVYPSVDHFVKEEDATGDFFDKYYCVANMKWFGEILCKMYSEKIKNPMTTVIVRPGNCFSSDTNMMTQQGIKNIKEINTGDKVYTLNPETFNVEISNVVNTIESNYNESILIKNKRGVDWEVTKDHNLFVSTRNFKYKFIKTGSLLSNKKTQRNLAIHKPFNNKENTEFFILGEYIDEDHYLCVFPEKGNRNDHNNIKKYELIKHNGNRIYYAQKKKRIKKYKEFIREFSGRIYIKDNICNSSFFPYKVLMEPFISLLGWFLSEGHISETSKNNFQICIAQGVKNNVNRINIEETIIKCCFKYGKNNDRYYFSSRLFVNFINSHMKKHSYNKRIPSFIFSLSLKYLNVLFDSLMDGDGHKERNRYTTNSLLLANDFFHLAFLLGYQPLIVPEKRKDNTIIYRIRLRLKNKRRTFKNSHINVKKYKNKETFYCITTEKNHIVYAGRNGCMGWIGQCYGPYDDFDWETSHVLPAMIRRVVERHDPIDIWGDGTDIKDFLYIDDFIDGLVCILENVEQHEVFNLARGQGVTLSDALENILEVDGYSEAKVIYDKTKPIMIPKRLINIDKAKLLLGYEPKVSLKEGLEKTIEWYKEKING